MSLHTYKIPAVSLVLVCGVSPCTAYDISDVADPPEADVTYVGDVVQNGLPVQMKQFKVKHPVSEVFSFYKQRWTDTGNYRENVPFYIEKEVGNWHILSKMEDQCSVVVQARLAENGQTEGYISVSDISKQKQISEASTSFPRLVDSELISSTEAVDSGRLSTTLMIINDHSIDENNNYYRSSMDEQGWSYLQGGIRNNVAMLHFAKEKQQCEITISQMDDGKTVIFANLVQVKIDG